MNNEQVILRLTDWTTSKDTNDIFYMMNNDEGISNVFRARLDRVMAANISWMIQAGDKNIGFINLVEEKANHNYLFLDMGIIEEYRGKGYGKKFLKEVQEIVENNEEKLPFILMETMKNNDNANGVGKSVGCFITKFGDRNIYLLQRSRLQEFIDSNQMEELAKHFDQESYKKAIVKEYI